MDKGLIPRRYAKALYLSATERGQADKVYAMMQALEAAFAAEPRLSASLANPYVPDKDKTDLLTAAAGDGAADASVMVDFLKLLAQNHRLDMAREIALAYVAYYRHEHHIYIVKVASAAPLSDAVRNRLEQAIASQIGPGTLDFEYSVDPALIGGFTVSVDSQRLDASVAKQLDDLRRSMVN